MGDLSSNPNNGNKFSFIEFSEGFNNTAGNQEQVLVTLWKQKTRNNFTDYLLLTIAQNVSCGLYHFLNRMWDKFY